MNIGKNDRWIMEYAIHHATDAVVLDGHAVLIIPEKKFKVVKYFLDTNTFFSYPGVTECGVENFTVTLGEWRYCIGFWKTKPKGVA